MLDSTLMTTSNRLDVHAKLREIFVLYQPRVNLNIESDTLRLKTATTSEELVEVFRLRQETFAPDKPGQPKMEFEFDEFDASADHIIIIDKKSERIIGTYRMLFSKHVDKFYSENEFDLSEFLAKKEEKLELGRACVHEDFRSGSTIAMLWRGLAHYIDAVKPRFLFGCSSIHVTDKKSISQAFQYIKDNSYSEKYNIKALNNFKCEYDTNVEYDEREMKKMMPPLLRTYFNCGAAIHGEPALDTEFHCIDFMTILDFKKLNQSFWNRFFR